MADKDRVHGSIEVLKKVYSLYKQKKLTLEELFDIIKRDYPSFAVLFSLYEFLQEGHGDISLFLERMEENKLRVERKTLEYIDGFSTVFTYSRSSQVRDVLMKKRKLERVFITEGRPHNEGVVLAKELAENGISVTLGIDAAMGEFIRKSDCVLLGSDAVFDEYFVNKIGTSLVLQIAEVYNKPVFIMALPEKRVKKEFEKYYKILDEPPTEVTELSEEYHNISVFNRYFEKVYLISNRTLII